MKEVRKAVIETAKVIGFSEILKQIKKDFKEIKKDYKKGKNK